jgi:diacylglycerol kinase family enzyme
MDILEQFSGRVRELIGFSRQPPKTKLVDVHMIVNPKAGRFRRKSTLEEIINGLEEKIIRIKDSNYYNRYIRFSEYLTKNQGHAIELAQNIVDAPSDHAYKLIIVVSGDGGYNEVCTGILQAKRPTKDIRVLHIPFGSGNDTAEIKDLDESYDLITGSHNTKTVNVLKVSDGYAHNSYAFNIASIGIDGYIAQVANDIKKVFGKASYWVASKIAPISFYTKMPRYNDDFIRVFTNNNSKKDVYGNHLIIAMGCKGYSEYGHGMKILPDENNVCIIDYMGLFRLMKSEKKLYNGKHGSLPEVHFYASPRIEIRSNLPLWLQRDGETSQVRVKNLPLIFHLLENKIQKVIPD